MKIKRRGFWILLILAALLCGCQQNSVEEPTGIWINGVAYAPETEALDLRGMADLDPEQLLAFAELRFVDLRDTGITAEEYEIIRAGLPECTILWSVPFQGGFVESNAEGIRVDTLTEADIACLDYLVNLQYVDGTGCADYAQLQTLQARRPDCRVEYTLKIDGAEYAPDAAHLDLTALNREILDTWQPYLPALESITLTGIQENVEELLTLQETHPELEISWDMDFFGTVVNSRTEEVDISGAQITDIATWEALVTRLPKVKKVVMSGCGISNEDMDALNRRHEDILFVWTVTIRGVPFRTDITYLMPCQYDLWPTTKQSQDYKYFTELICLDLGHHSISDCSFVAYMPKLQYLLLGDTKIYDLTPLEGLQDLVYLEIFMTEVRDFTPLLTLKNLECLNITYSYGQAKVVAQLTWVDYIRWITSDDRMLTPEEQIMLQECLTDTYLELGIGQSSTGGMWRQTQRYFEQRDILGMEYMTG